MKVRILILTLCACAAYGQMQFPHYSAPVAAAAVPSYDNPMGMGDRQAAIDESHNSVFGGGIASLIDGNRSDATTWFTAQNTSGLLITFDFGAPQIITEIKFYQQNTAEHGTWIVQAHNGGGWDDVGGSFTLGGEATQTITTPSANTTGYRYYILAGLSGTTNNGPYVYEFEFKIVAE